MIQFNQFQFEPVIHLPVGYEVYDFSAGYDAGRTRSSDYGVGRYNEKRKNMYTTELFGGQRDIHMGVDIAAPVGTSVYAFYAGKVFMQTYNSAPGDYGYTLITEHDLAGTKLYALFGHLNSKSIEERKVGETFCAGDVLAWVGDKHENGGWNPHLHFQLSYLRPEVCDMPGAVSDADLTEALKTYPDPQLVLGKLY